MMAYSEDHIALAAEYALGTLDAQERAQVENMMAADQAFAALVEGWERKLGPLNQMVGSVEPSPELWDKIKAEVGIGRQQSPQQQSPELPPSVSDVAPPAPATVARPEAAPDRSNVIVFSRRARRWRGIAAAMAALAASLVALVATQIYNPDLLPAGIRPKTPPQRVVQVPGPPAPAAAQYVAVLQKDASSPAFILSVDAATKNFTVRKVAATSEPGKSYELWLVSDKLQRPRSLGVIGNRDFTSRPALGSYDSDTVSKATYAVTVEPEGGSPTGAPTGSVVFAGKLIEAVPPAQPPR